jgi:hypothetical protein
VGKMIFKYLKIFLALTFLAMAIAVAVFYFNPKYIKEKAAPFANKVSFNINDCYVDKIAVEVPASYELVQIAFSLTETFQLNNDLLNRNTSYYRDVDLYFSKFKNHELIKKIDKYIAYNDASRSNMYNSRFYSLFYDINDDNRLVKNGMVIPKYPMLLKLYNSDYFILMENTDLINDFAKKTNFIAFYNSHKSYYTKLIELSNQLCQFDNMKDWMEQKFANKYSSYRIIFSPLTGGSHNTVHIEDIKKGVNQAIMFVCAPDENLQVTDKDFEIKAGQMARVVFTEIDHNYVNPLTDRYETLLISAMPSYKAWNSQKVKYYSSSNSVFNEYMTWGVFNLYALDTYSKENMVTIIQTVEQQMLRRNFHRFPAFNEKLMVIYKEKSKPTIEQLYEPMLEWVKAETRH